MGGRSRRLGANGHRSAVVIELKQWDASSVIVSVRNQIAEEAAKLFNERGVS